MDMFMYKHTNNFLDFSFLGFPTIFLKKSLPKNPPNSCEVVTLLKDADSQEVTRLQLFTQLYFKRSKSCNLLLHNLAQLQTQVSIKGYKKDVSLLTTMIISILHVKITQLQLHNYLGWKL